MSLFKLNLSDERGIALPVALAVLFSVAGLATVAARSAIVADHQTFRDRNAKGAIEGAQSGLQAATHELNMLQPGLDKCVAKHPTTGDLSVVPAPGVWCDPVTETLGDGTSYQVWVSKGTHMTVNGQNIDERKVVAIGTANGVTRRATYTIDAATGSSLFPKGYSMVGRDTVQFKNNTTFTGGGIGSNGDIIFKNNTDVCGPVTYGPGGSFTAGSNFGQCAGAPPPAAATQPFPLQPVDMTAANASNQNVYITRAVGTPPQPTPKDSCSNCGSISWDSSTRVLTLGGSSVLTLTGDVYSLCSLTLTGSAQLQIAARTTPMTMYIDSPESCGGGPGMGSATFDGTFVNVNPNASTFVLQVAGSPFVSTTVGIADNSSHASSPMAIYAPNSTVDFKNDLNWKGAIVAKTIKVKNNATIEYDSSIEFILSGSSTRLYEAQGYKECANDPASTDPSSGC